MRRVIAAAFAPAEDDAIDLSSIELAEFVEWITIPDVSTKLDDDDDDDEEEEEEEEAEEDVEDLCVRMTSSVNMGSSTTT